MQAFLYNERIPFPSDIAILMIQRDWLIMVRKHLSEEGDATTFKLTMLGQVKRARGLH